MWHIDENFRNMTAEEAERRDMEEPHKHQFIHVLPERWSQERQTPEQSERNGQGPMLGGRVPKFLRRTGLFVEAGIAGCEYKEILETINQDESAT